MNGLPSGYSGGWVSYENDSGTISTSASAWDSGGVCNVNVTIAGPGGTVAIRRQPRRHAPSRVRLQHGRFLRPLRWNARRLPDQQQRRHKRPEPLRSPERHLHGRRAGAEPRQRRWERQHELHVLDLPGRQPGPHRHHRRGRRRRPLVLRHLRDLHRRRQRGAATSPESRRSPAPGRGYPPAARPSRVPAPRSPRPRRATTRSAATPPPAPGSAAPTAGTSTARSGPKATAPTFSSTPPRPRSRLTTTAPPARPTA